MRRSQRGNNSLPFYAPVAPAILVLGLVYGCQPFEPERVGSVVIDSTTNITYTSCSVWGTIIDPGALDITGQGFCWSLLSGPTVSDQKTPAGDNATGDDFTADITGLEEGETYYVRAYIQNSDEVIYSEEIQFETLAFREPDVRTDSVLNSWYNYALCWGTVLDNGGRIVLSRGICWSTQTAPTIIQDSTSTSGAGTGSFVCELRGLKANTKYYVRTFAINAEGTSYGNEISFTTSPSTGTGTVTDIDGNQYNTVKLGNQWWMAENLKTTKYPDGTGIQLIQGNTSWVMLDSLDQAYCLYNNSDVNGFIYGALYTWAAVMDGNPSSKASPSGVRGICPDGWHVPSDGEWKELEIYLGMSREQADQLGERGSDEGARLKETSTGYWEVNTPTTNATGFAGLPGGYRDNSSGEFSSLGYYGYFWTASQSSSTHAWIRKLQADLTTIGRQMGPKDSGRALRCVRDFSYSIVSPSGE
jgi:uncharacterized protein (TIGR02145 family)